MANGVPDPYNLDDILSNLGQSRELIGDQLATQQQQFQDLMADINASATQSQAAINAFNQQVQEALATSLDRPDPVSVERTQIDIDSVVAPMRDALNEQITNMKTSYQSQVAVQAKQLDALMGTGAFGGNTFRAQQAYQASMNQLMGQALGQIAQTTLTAEGNIMAAVGELTGLQAQLTQEAVGLEAQLNVEQDIRFRELQSNREVALLGLLGQSAEMTVEAGAVLTNNWLNLFHIKNQSVNQLVEMMSQINITEAGIRQTLARDLFQAEMQAISNQVNLNIAYRQAAAQEYAAWLGFRASKRAARAQEYAAELSADAAVQVAQTQAQAQVDVAQLQRQAVVDVANVEAATVEDLLPLVLGGDVSGTGGRAFLGGEDFGGQLF
jgi:hypothetical protein